MENSNLFFNEAQQKSISKEELDLLKSLRDRSQALALQKQVADLELRNLVLEIYLKYGLSEKHSINELTGEILLLDSPDQK